MGGDHQNLLLSKHHSDTMSEQELTVSNSSDSSKALPPFLQKLKKITETVPIDIADWSSDGLSYVIKDNEKFEEVLKLYFKGSLQTFIRQLHFYGFRKLDANSGWSFVHKHFLRDRPDLVSEIRRKTRNDAASNIIATQVEVELLRSQVATLQNAVEDLQEQLKTALSSITTNSATTTDSRDNDGCKDRKRGRYEHNSFLTLSNSDCGSLDMCDDMETIKLNDNSVDNESLDGFVSQDLFCDEVDSSVASVLEPYPVDMEGIEEILDMGVSEKLYTQLGDDLEDSIDFDAAATKEAEKEMLIRNKLSTLANAVDVVAEATELDSLTVKKVLAFVKKAVKSEGHQNKKLSNDVHSFMRIESVLLKDRPRTIPLPTQEVGAN